jgi:ABC-type arginine transport system ATPase subunit
MRGRSWKDCFVLLDEAQNATPQEMKMFLTRIGENCVTVVNGDVAQCDLDRTSGLRTAMTTSWVALRKELAKARPDHLPVHASNKAPLPEDAAVARALVGEPSILLADEPTGNLDSRTSIEIMGIFQQLNDQGITVVMVTHELDIARYCRRVIVMRDGLVRSDEQVRDRFIASSELARLDAEQKAVQLA